MSSSRPAVALTAAGLLALLTVQTVVLFVRPALSEPGHTDALILLQPSDPLVDAADELMAAGAADELIIMHEEGTRPYVCTLPHPYPVRCDEVHGSGPLSGTRNQVRSAVDTARRAGHDSLAFAVPAQKVTRVRRLSDLCGVDAAVYAPVRGSILSSLREWPALLYTFVRPRC